jgi:hypothetical protein
VYLVDTNVWLERLLEQTSSHEVGQFLERTPAQDIFLTDFGFHSLAVVLTRLNRTGALLEFVRDAFIDGAVQLVRLEPQDTSRLVEVISRFSFDFDDAYQYVAAERHNLTIVSFDADFDRTERGRRTPAQVMAD